MKCPSCKLQWGRKLMLPEMPEWGHRVTTCDCFNGAGSLCSRKCHKRATDGYTYELLQWGRKLMLPEIVASAHGCSNDTSLQWGRKLMLPEIVRDGDDAQHHAGFNGAGSLCSRKWRAKDYADLSRKLSRLTPGDLEVIAQTGRMVAQPFVEFEVSLLQPCADATALKPDAHVLLWNDTPRGVAPTMAVQACQVAQYGADWFSVVAPPRKPSTVEKEDARP